MWVFYGKCSCWMVIVDVQCTILVLDKMLVLDDKYWCLSKNWSLLVNKELERGWRMLFFLNER